MDDKELYEEGGALPGNTEEDTAGEGHSDYKPAGRFDAAAVHHLSGMYKTWFLDYASYVILERAVPNIDDGFKPVQRRILHSMRRMDDGRYNKVANIVGHTMQFHPHGDASIGDALVQMGQKDLLVDTQGNWGNILTGDRAAAPRYIEARLSKFAIETVFNPKTTQWQLSYDGRNKEPVAFPAKFPLLLAQGAEGIAVGLSSKILPHNVGELCSAAIAYLKGEDFRLYPDFPTGGAIDVGKYNDGQRGGSVRVRAKIEKVDSKTLAIREIPYGKNTGTLIDSILKAVEKGKIKAKKVDDNTSASVEILVHLAPGVSSDKTMDALYAFSDCEVSISPNCCVIRDNKPVFLSVGDVLRHSADRTVQLLRTEIEIHRGELAEALFFASLERIFIEQRIYKDKAFENADSTEAAIRHIAARLEPFTENFARPVEREDIERLLEIKMQRILKFNKDKADDFIAKTKAGIEKADHDLAHIVDVAVDWFTHIAERYAADHPRRTEIKSFDTIVAAKVVEANEKLYINRAEGFIGTGLKKDEFVCNCSDIDDIIVFYRDGKYKVVKVGEKLFVGKNVIHVQVFKKGDHRTTYNAVYRDGKRGAYYMKRFNVTGVTRDKEYDLTAGEPMSKVCYFTANPNGEAEVIKAVLEPQLKLKKIFIERDFAQIAIKGRAAKGNLLTKWPVHRIGLKSHGRSTLGGRKVWFDQDVKRLNYDARGTYLGEFTDPDQVLVILATGEYYATSFDAANHYPDNVDRVEKLDKDKVWTAVLADHDNGGFTYVKRFLMEPTKKPQSFIGENPANRLIAFTDTPAPRLLVTFGGADAFREQQEIDASQFVSVKGFKAKGKRISTWEIGGVEILEPLCATDETEVGAESPDNGSEGSVEEEEDLDIDKGKTQQQVIDEITGQLNLFGEDR